VRGEANLPSFLTYRLILVVLATDRQDKAVYTEAQPIQLISKIPSGTVPSRTPCCSGVRHIRTSGNEPAEIYGAASSRSQKCLLGTGAWCIWIPSTHFSIKAQQLSRKWYMLWMSLKLQVTKLAACLCILMSFSNLSRKQLLPGTSSDSVLQRRHPFSIKYIFVKLATPWTAFGRSLFKQILYEDEF
jgi:hypothetical protein